MATKKSATSSTKSSAARKAAPVKKSGEASKTSAGAALAKRTSNAAFMKPVAPTAILAAAIGDKPMPRTEVTKKIWDYIKRNDLQDKNNRRMINADEKLKPVFGGKDQVSMFEMTKLVSAQLK